MRRRFSESLTYGKTSGQVSSRVPHRPEYFQVSDENYAEMREKYPRLWKYLKIDSPISWNTGQVMALLVKNRRSKDPEMATIGALKAQALADTEQMYGKDYPKKSYWKESASELSEDQISGILKEKWPRLWGYVKFDSPYEINWRWVYSMRKMGWRESEVLTKLKLKNAERRLKELGIEPERPE